MARFELVLVCPIHPKSLAFFQIDAKDEFEAVGNAIGQRAICESIPHHSFVIHAENIIGWQPLTPSYMPSELAEHVAYRPPAYAPPTPSEKIYYVDPQTRLEKLKEKEWWR
jgi:hypothetical protein